MKLIKSFLISIIILNNNNKVSGTLHALVRVSAEFESNITSIERIEEYCNTPHEVNNFFILSLTYF